MRTIFILGIFLSTFYSKAQLSPILPIPNSIERGVDTIYFDSFFPIDLTSLDNIQIDFFRVYLKKLSGLDIKQGTAQDLKIVKNVSQFNPNPYEHYLLNYTSTDKTIYYSTLEGKMHGLVSLLQLIEKNEKGPFIVATKIGDHAKFKWRGMHLDVSRHFFSVDEVKQYIDYLAFYKFNKFHWHLTDDQGWRIEIKKYPKLTEIGSIRSSTMVGHYNDEPRTYDGVYHTGYYTQKDVKDVVAYANALGIEVIPEIELPGHARAALAAYPELSCTEEFQEVPGTWGVFEDIFCSKKESIDFLKDVLSEVVELFPSKYVHIGGDEAPKTRWKKCEKCQNVIQENNLKDEHELQSYFISQMDQFLTSKGKLLIGWDEILEGGLSPNATVMSWRGFEGGIEAAEAGHAVIMTPTQYCYFDYYQSSSKDEPLAIGGYLPIEKVYEFNPIPNDLPREFHKNILGGQANVWTEYIPDMMGLHHMIFPRMIAMSQVLWSNEKPSFKRFISSYDHYGVKTLYAYGGIPSQAIYFPKIHPSKSSNGVKYTISATIPEATFILGKSINGVGIVPNGEIKSGYEIEKQPGKETDQICVKWEGQTEYLVQSIDNHIGLGAEMKFNTSPHPKYNFNETVALVDGIKGQRPWKGSEWLGFNSSTVDFEIKLKQKQKINALEVGCLKAEGSWIYLPEEIVVYRKFGIFWLKTKKATSIHEDTILEIGKKIRHLRIKLKGLDQIPQGREGAGFRPWTFIDEVKCL